LGVGLEPEVFRSNEEVAVPKVLLLTGDAAESLEVMYPYQRLLEEGYEVDIAAPTAKKLQFVIHDFVDEFDTYTEKLGYTWPADVAFADVDPSQYVALVIPGGRAPEYIRNDPDVQRIVRHFMEGDLPVAQLCHAPLVLAAAGTLQGRRTAAYPALETDVKAAGAEYVDGAASWTARWSLHARGPDNPAWMREFIEVLRAKAPVSG
jgi:protease I